MRTERAIPHRFVDFIPDDMEEDTLYISLEFSTAIHKCLCGCGNQVVTPFSPTDWRLLFDGSVSLEPSIGNWRFECRSHYWITQNTVEWAGAWSDTEIAAGRLQDTQRKNLHFGSTLIQDDQSSLTKDEEKPPTRGLWERLVRWLFRR
jgi:uncharacterized protein DUF6527